MSYRNSILCLMLSCFIAQISLADIINVPKSALASEKKTMNFLIDNYFNERDIENPQIRNRIKRNIKKWNGHIKDWKYLEDSLNIYYYKDSPEYELSVGGGINFFEDDRIQSSSNLVKLSFNIKHHLQLRYYIFGILDYSTFAHTIDSDVDRSFDNSSSLDIEMGFKRILQNPNWQQSLSLQKEKLSVLSSLMAQTNHDYSETELYRDIIETSSLSFLWLRAGLEYYFTFWGTRKTGILQGLYGYALSGKLLVDKYGKEEVVTGHKFELLYKQYIKNDYWAKLNIRQTMLYSGIEMANSSFLVSGGMNF